VISLQSHSAATIFLGSHGAMFNDSQMVGSRNHIFVWSQLGIREATGKQKQSVAKLH